MDPNEVFRLVLALALSPLIVMIGSRIDIPRARRPFLLGYCALIVSFALRLYQSTPLRSDEVRAVFHLAFALGGAGFAWAAWELRKHVLAMRGRTSG